VPCLSLDSTRRARLFVAHEHERDDVAAVRRPPGIDDVAVESCNKVRPWKGALAVSANELEQGMRPCNCHCRLLSSPPTPAAVTAMVPLLVSAPIEPTLEWVWGGKREAVQGGGDRLRSVRAARTAANVCSMDGSLVG
jgi:hypothetical protein